MYRVTFSNTRRRTLVGILYQTQSKSIIIMCHGFTSDKFSQGRAEQLAKAYETVGYSVLMFDFSGCGESDDDILTIDKEIDDLQSAISYVRSIGYKNIGLYGHSLGAYICLQCSTDDITTMVLTGALTGRMFYTWEDYFTPEQLVELAKSGHIVFPVTQQFRNSLIIDKSVLDEFSNVDHIVLLSQVKQPVLLIHGDGDDEAKQLLKNSQQGLGMLPAGSKIEVIEGAPHSFMEHIDKVIQLSIRWYLQRLPRS